MTYPKELCLLKEHLHTTTESLEPINLIKNTIKEISSSSDIKSNILNTAIGFGVGFMIKKLWIGRTRNPIKRLLGTLIQLAFANVISKNAGRIKSTGEYLRLRYLKYRKES